MNSAINSGSQLLLMRDLVVHLQWLTILLQWHTTCWQPTNFGYIMVAHRGLYDHINKDPWGHLTIYLIYLYHPYSCTYAHSCRLESQFSCFEWYTRAKSRPEPAWRKSIMYWYKPRFKKRHTLVLNGLFIAGIPIAFLFLRFRFCGPCGSRSFQCVFVAAQCKVRKTTFQAIMMKNRLSIILIHYIRGRMVL